MSLDLDQSTRTIMFRVLGEPSPQAGTKTVPIRTKTGRTVYRKITEGGVGLAPWRQAVADAAALAAEQHDLCFGEPVTLSVLFRFAMPKSRSKALRSLGAGPRAGKPDSDKLIRAVGDSLKAGGLIRDDALIVDLHVRKIEVWESWTGAVITIGPAPVECWRLDGFVTSAPPVAEAPPDAPSMFYRSM